MEGKREPRLVVWVKEFTKVDKFVLPYFKLGGMFNCSANGGACRIHRHVCCEADCHPQGRGLTYGRWGQVCVASTNTDNAILPVICCAPWRWPCPTMGPTPIEVLGAGGVKSGWPAPTWVMPAPAVIALAKVDKPVWPAPTRVSPVPTVALDTEGGKPAWPAPTRVSPPSTLYTVFIPPTRGVGGGGVGWPRPTSADPEFSTEATDWGSAVLLGPGTTIPAKPFHNLEMHMGVSCAQPHDAFVDSICSVTVFFAWDACQTLHAVYDLANVHLYDAVAVNQIICHRHNRLGQHTLIVGWSGMPQIVAPNI